ncbi:MAG: AMP-dependent synthetase/ligase [Chloroflexota bacterium]
MSSQTERIYSAAPPARHIGQIFFQRVEELGDRLCVKSQKKDGFETVSWREFGALVQYLLLALYDLRLTPGEAVAIIGENSLPWLCADLATLAGGLPNVVVSPALSDALLLKVLGHSQCRAAFVENAAAVRRLSNLQSQLPALSQIFVMQDHEQELSGTHSFDELIERGKAADPKRLGEVLDAVQPGDLATIMYTSGSTGEPKGVMRTQHNLLSNITNGGEIAAAKSEELFLVVLSLNHLLGRFGFLKSAVTGRSTAIIEATELELDLNVVEALAGTAMALVPRVMERIWHGILDRGRNRWLWQEIETLDLRKAKQGLSESESEQFEAHRGRLKEAVRRALGGRIKYISYSGAAMPPRIMRFFELMGIPLIGSYGSTECGGVTLCGIGDNRPGNLGKPFPNVEVRIAADSEILVRGPTVSPGYLHNPEATREVLDAEGWFHTGDLGALDADGSLRIIGRKKDVFYCSEGSNIYPSFIESQLENEPFIRQAVLLGDRRAFIAALIVPDRRAIAAALARDEASLADGEIETLVWRQIDTVNERLEHYEKIRKIALMRTDFPTEVRSINVFQKTKIDRQLVAKSYRREIDEIYASSGGGVH